MADLVITATSVLAGSSARKKTGTAGAAITAGKVVYLDPADNKYKLADNNDAAATIRKGVGIALHASSDGQPLTIIERGPIVIGAALTLGATYYLSDTPGGICPFADLATGEYVVALGVASSTTTLQLAIQHTNAAIA